MKKTLPFIFLLLTACSTVPKIESGTTPSATIYSAENTLENNVIFPIQIYDPFEGLNRQIYKFNALFDDYVFLPIVNGYEFITPKLVQHGVSNFFSNLGEIQNISNTLLQFKLVRTAKTTGRFIVNSTLGIAGLWDPATDLGLDLHTEDFGQTLGYWGVGDGAYLVLPVFGPSSIRDGLGLVVDAAIKSTFFYLALDLNTFEITGVNTLNGIDTRHQNSFRYYNTGSPFEYDLVRYLYNKERQFEIDH